MYCKSKIVMDLLLIGFVVSLQLRKGHTGIVPPRFHMEGSTDLYTDFFWVVTSCLETTSKYMATWANDIGGGLKGGIAFSEA
jgi:hypothetical protein